MLKFLHVLFLICLYFNLFSQEDDEISRIIPPSPEATQMILYGNNNVNYYTGAVDVKIPIYTINENGFQLPIALSYSGSNGIRVTETASWVGLGWNLIVGGVISRTIRGVADDDKFKGGLLYKKLPVPEIEDNLLANVQEFKDILNGKRDGEPDQFHYNIPGYSGSFYLKTMNGEVKVIQKPYSNCIIIPKINEQRNRFSLESFTIITPEGITFKFTEEEKTRSYSFGMGSNLSDLDYRTTSWYLTHITNYNKSFNIYLEYYTLNEINIIEEVASNEIWTDETYQEFYQTYLTQNPKRIKKISFTNGYVFFEKSTLSRCDVKNDCWLNDIKVFQSHTGLTLIDKYTFSYDYFTDNGHRPLNTEAEAEDLKLRLCLKSVQRKAESPYILTYNDDVYLPSRDSKARDHWGFYNGTNRNETLEPKYRVLYISGMVGTEPIIQKRIVGEADRFPDPKYSQAGMLTKVTYPVGGYTIFEYENHKVSNDRESIKDPLRKLNKFIQNNIDNKVLTITLPVRETNDYSNTLTTEKFPMYIKLIDQPFAIVNNRLMGRYIQHVEYWLILKNKSDDKITSYCLFDGENIDYRSFYIEKGNYECYLKIIDPNLYYQNNNGDNKPLILNLKWENELNTPQRIVGGLRIKSIINHDGTKTYKKVFSYLSSLGMSSGKIGIVPKYGFEALQGNISGSIANLNNYVSKTFIRTVNTDKPLVFTNGSCVGYSRVEEKQLNDQNIDIGKIVYEYTTFSDFNDVRCYYTEYPEDLNYAYNFLEKNVVDGLCIPVDSKDALRGKITSQKTYDKEGNEVKSVSYTYQKINYDPDLRILQRVKQDEFVIGLVCKAVGKNSLNAHFPSGSNTSSLSMISPDDYAIFGYYKDFGVWVGNHVTETKYQGVTSKTINHYFNIDEFAEKRYFQLSQQQIVLDSSNNQFINYKYPYDFIDLDSENNLAKEKLLQKNVLIPLEKQVLFNKDTIEIIRSDYRLNSNNLIVKDKIRKWEKGIGLKTEIEFNKYDNKSNLLCANESNNIEVVFYWNSNKTLPIAKFENVSYSDIYNNAALIANLNQMSSITNLYKEENRILLLELNTKIRELLPEDVFVTTFTHNPLVGISSQTDNRGRTTYYSYDNLGRLTQVHDHNYNILKKTDYHTKIEY